MPPEEGPGYEEEEVVNKEVDKEEMDIEKRRGSEEEMLERRDSQVCPTFLKAVLCESLPINLLSADSDA